MSSRRSPSANRRIELVVRECVARIEQVIRAEVAARLETAVARALRARESELPAGVRKGSGRDSPRPPRLCPVPACGRPAAGPKYAWRCREHKAVSREEILLLREASPSRAPGAQPEQPRRNGPSMECRAPGCATKSRGPRYEFFCGEHHSALDPAERRALAEQWRQARRRPSEPLSAE